MHKHLRTPIALMVAAALCSCTFEHSKNRMSHWSQKLGITDSVDVSRESWVLHPSTHLYVVAVGNPSTQSDLQVTVGTELANALDYEFTRVVRGGTASSLEEALRMAYLQRCEFLVVPSFLRTMPAEPLVLDVSEGKVVDETAPARASQPDQLRIHLVDVANAQSAEAAIIKAESGLFTASSGEKWRKKILATYAHSLARAARPAY